MPRDTPSCPTRRSSELDTAEQTTLGAVVSLTVKVVVQVALLVAASVGESVRVYSSNLSIVYAAGGLIKMIAHAPRQASLTLTSPMKLGTTAMQLAETMT